jgi:hypothetical protein
MLISQTRLFGHAAIMIATVIRFILANYSLTFFLLGIVCALASIIVRRVGTAHSAFEAFLFYYCLFAVGFNYFYNFIMHVFFSRMAAHFIGWQTSPFQTEVGFASLGFAAVGFLAAPPEFGRRLAAVVGPTLFLWGAAGRAHLSHDSGS